LRFSWFVLRDSARITNRYLVILFNIFFLMISTHQSQEFVQIRPTPPKSILIWLSKV
jgi:hypothetical protein